MADLRVSVKTELTLDGTPIRVALALLRESIFALPTLVCEATEGESTPEAEAVIGKPASLLMQQVEGSGSREFHGLVASADRFVDPNGNFRLRVEIVPRLWKLSRRTDCAQFQQMSVPDVVKKVLSDGGVTDAEWKLSGSYDKRKWIVQYRETDLDFVMRLLAEEGIWFAIHHDSGKDVVVFCDDPTGSADVAGTKSLPFRHAFGFAEAADWVTRVRRVTRVRSDKVQVRDWDFEKPKLDLDGKKESKDPGPHALEVYAWPARAPDQGTADRYAQLLLDSLQADKDVVEGETGVLTLAPGLRFAIEEHPYSALDGEYLVTTVTFEMRDELWGATLEGGGEKHGFRCRFSGIPTKVAYRPARRDVARRAPGLQTALTTGPSGEEIHTDKHGRVKVLFPWDRVGKKDDTSSDWFRTSQLPTGGAVFLPRVGWEVSVDFLEGDVDRPLVFQRMYNGVSKPPYDLPKNKARGSIQTATTPGGGSTNEFRMDDTKGKEEMFFNASKDMSVDVRNNATESVKNNETREIGSNHSLAVTNSVDHKIGANETVKVGANQEVKISTFHVDDVGGDHSLTIAANRNMKIGGDHKTQVKSDSTFTIGSIMTDLVVGSVSESTPASYTHTVGAAHVMICKERSIIAGGPRSETVGALKVMVSNEARGVDVGAMLSKTVGGAILNKISGDRNDNAEAIYQEVVGGAQIVKANNITFEASEMLTLVMGASTVTITPASVMIAGASLKADAALVDTGIVIDN